MNTWLPVVAFLVVVILIVAERRARRSTLALVEEYARDELELLRQVRWTLEDLIRIEPERAESMEAALVDLAEREPYIAALSRGDYTELRRLKRGSEQ